MKTKIKKYFNVDIHYTNNTYIIDRILMFIQNDLILALFAFCVIALALFNVFIFKISKSFANQIISEYAVGILDRVFIYFVLFTIIAFIATISFAVIYIFSENINDIKWTPCCFFLKQKYMKFLWKDHHIFCFHELPDDKGHITALEELIKNFNTNFQFYYEKKMEL